MKKVKGICSFVSCMMWFMMYWKLRNNIDASPTKSPLSSSIQDSTKPMQPFQLLKQQEALDSSCIAMFNIGYARPEKYGSRTNFFYSELNDSNWNQLLIAKKNAFQTDENYLPFVKSIPKLVTSSNGILKVQNKTRLQLMGGQVPYIPCSIKEYSDSELDNCWKLKQRKDETIWLLFYGDSRSRNMFFYFAKRTQKIRTWAFQTKGESNLEYDKITRLRLMKPMTAISREGDKLEFVPAIYGLRHRGTTDHPRKYLLNLLMFAKNGEKLPNFLIINYGAWEFNLLPLKDVVAKYETLITHWNQLKKILEQLSRHMLIIINYQTRSRPTHIDRENRYFKLQDFETRQGDSFTDDVMSATIRKSKMIFWDSTLPFNLATIPECLELEKNNHSLLVVERLDKFKPFQQFMCFDRNHRTRSTLQDETTILINLLCNKLRSRYGNNYCCT